ncbi:MAG: hypothetical protein EXS35_19105 [Pedosphaera sp.]|nr:hypothetical protein [Pedosphaera sp.]
MIAIVSTVERERAAFAALCASRGWLAAECDSVRALVRLLRRSAPKVALVRHKLRDGYSDNAIAALATAGALPATRIIVLIGAGTASSAEARQLALGADCVLRDPVRIDVLSEYLAKYCRPPRPSRADARKHVATTLSFAGASLHPAERLLRQGDQTASLTPREVELVELLAGSSDEVVTYETLYSEILGRRFRGDTSNMRVLLGKLGASSAVLGIAVRQWVEVIPKLGYRYRAASPGKLTAARTRQALRSAA